MKRIPALLVLLASLAATPAHADEKSIEYVVRHAKDGDVYTIYGQVTEIDKDVLNVVGWEMVLNDGTEDIMVAVGASRPRCSKGSVAKVTGSVKIRPSCPGCTIDLTYFVASFVEWLDCR